MCALRDALGTSALRRLQAAWAAVSLGGWTFFITLAVYAYGVGGATAVGVAAVARMVPAALAAPLMSMLGDRHSRRNVLLVLCFARALVLACAAALVWFGGPAAAVFALAALFTAIGTGHRPAQAALLPSLADDPRQLAASNAVWSAVDSIGFLAGSLCAGALIAVGGTELALAATAAAFLLATLALAGIPADRRPEPVAAHELQIAEGFRAVGADRRLRTVVAVLGVSTLVEGAIDVLVVLIALELLGLGAAGVGWLNSAWGLGGVLGGAGAVMLIARGRNATALVVASLLVGVPLIALTAFPTTSVAVIGLIVLGVGYAVIEVAGLTLVQRLASDAVLARAFGVVEGTYWLTTGLGSLLAPVLVALIGLRGALVVVGLVLPLLVVARWRALQRLEASAPVPEAEYRLLRELGMFAPLPIAKLEELARRAAHVHAAAGAAIVREGEAGDRFYVIADGSVEVTEHGRFRRTEVAGDCFGEIALLRAVPRTATVVAVTDVDLLALEREEFLAAITGDHRALAAGHDLVETRLAPSDGLSLSAAEMRTLGYQAVDLLVDRLSDPSIPALRRATPAEMAARVSGPPPATGREFGEVLAQLSSDVLPYMNRADHPRFFAFIPSCQTFPGALGDFIASALNVYVGSWMEAAGPSQVELTVLDWFREWMGLPESAAGVLVSGGSAANMTALACARESLLGPMTDRVVAYVSDQAHSSLARAARLLGFRPDQLRVLPAGPDLRLHARTLSEAIAADVAAGRAPLFASVSGGSTNTGAVDSLDELADVCREHGVWMHVDAAYGGFAALTARGQSLLHGIARADSIALDPHKWLYQPMECGALLVRDGKLLRRAFEIVPDYLKDAAVEAGEVNFSDMGLQLTRGWRALKIWLSLQTLGLDAFRTAIDSSLDLAALAEERVRAMPALELMSPAHLGIVCFRRRFPGDEEEVAALNAALVSSLEATGEAFVSSTRLHGAYAVRLCVLNHTSRAADVEWVLDWFASAEVPARPARASRQRRADSIADARAGRRGPFAVDTIRALPLFDSLPVVHAERVSDYARERVCAPGEIVVRRHQLERDFYVIVSGRAGVDIDGEHVRDLYAGEFFGELAALDWGAGFGYARSATVTAVTELRLLVLPPRELRELMRAAPTVARDVQAAARERLRRT